MTIEEILEEYGIPIAPEGHHHSTSDFHQIDCPWCSPNSNHWRMGLSRNGYVALCWVCGKVSLFDTLKELTGLPGHEVAKLKSGIDSTYRERKIKHRGKLILPKGVAPMLDCHKRYLRKRGFDPEKLAKLWGIQGIGLASKLAWRLFIPVVYQGETVSWTTRSIVDDGVRYINAPPDMEAVPLKDTLFSLDYARHSIIVTEGPLDAIKIGPGAVCTFGVNATAAQINKIISYPVRVIIFDAERDAQKRAKQLCNELAPFPGKTIRVTLKGKDAASFSDEEIQELRREFLDD